MENKKSGGEKERGTRKRGKIKKETGEETQNTCGFRSSNMDAKENQNSVIVL